jgi:hypothetical protein
MMGAPAPYGAAPQDFGGQVQQGFNQVNQAFNEFGSQVNQAMQPYGQQPGGAMMMGAQPGALAAGGAPKSWMTTLLLCAFVGGFGVHRFYTGHTVIGVLQLLTGGGCGIWWLVDLIMLITGKYTDAQGRPLVKE